MEKLERTFHPIRSLSLIHLQIVSILLYILNFTLPGPRAVNPSKCPRVPQLRGQRALSSWGWGRWGIELGAFPAPPAPVSCTVPAVGSSPIVDLLSEEWHCRN